MGGRLILGYQKSLPTHDILIQKSLPTHDILILLGFFWGGYTCRLF
ncbi:MAG: hypothetical protein RIS60_1411 [Pseudomonadota bacterium]